MRWLVEEPVVGSLVHEGVAAVHEASLQQAEQKELRLAAPAGRHAAFAVPTGCGLRQEILFEYYSADDALAYFRYRYPIARFTRHPTMNGFFAFGPRQALLSIKAEVPNLDKGCDL